MSARPVWAEISLPRLLRNYQRLCAAVPPGAGLLPVVKANAYGHGLVLCGPALAAAGAQWLGVTCAEEGVALRAACESQGVAPGRPGTPGILLMSGLWSGQAEAVLEHHLTPVIWEPGHLDLLEAAAARRGMPPQSLPVHLEIDTGMSRQGVRVAGAAGAAERAAGAAGAAELDRLLARFDPSSCLRLEGVMTHFSTADTFLSTQENSQIASFSAAVRQIRAAGLAPALLHAGNSSTILAGPDAAKLAALAAEAGATLLLRPGLALYGYLDRMTRDRNPYSPPGEASYEPVLAWKTRVTSLRTLRRGETAGYGNTFVAERPSRLALLPAGYADGVNRLLSNRGHVLIRGELAPIAGRISMDQTIVDVTDVPEAAIGDEAVLLGRQGERSIAVWDLADLAGTIPWEVLCAIAARVPRIIAD